MAAARWPLIFGLADLDVNGQRAAAALADELGACLDNSAPATADDALFPGIGDAGCTWGEVRDRADLIIYWNCDPAQTHPRHNELILRPACQARKPRVLHIRAADTLSAAWTIRMVLKRGTTDDAWREFVDAVQCSRYGVIVHDHTTPRIALGHSPRTSTGGRASDGSTWAGQATPPANARSSAGSLVIPAASVFTTVAQFLTGQNSWPIRCWLAMPWTWSYQRVGPTDFRRRHAAR